MKYESNSKVQITPHFNAAEFKCKCGNAHTFEVSESLTEKLEKLFTAAKCSKIIVNSGFRCPLHDKNVGGNGNGQHTKGTAADVVCYDVNNKPIDTKKIACIAADVGFTGIGNIDKTYTAIHVDVRNGGIWYGDEAKGHTNTVTNDFYSYYGLTKSDVYGLSTGFQHTVELRVDGKTIFKKEL